MLRIRKTRIEMAIVLTTRVVILTAVIVIMLPIIVIRTYQS